MSIKPTCKRGHVLAGSNVQWKRQANSGKPYRECVACARWRAVARAEGQTGDDLVRRTDELVVLAASFGERVPLGFQPFTWVPGS
jgi:hypothetical protein